MRPKPLEEGFSPMPQQEQVCLGLLTDPKGLQCLLNPGEQHWKVGAGQWERCRRPVGYGADS